MQKQKLKVENEKLPYLMMRLNRVGLFMAELLICGSASLQAQRLATRLDFEQPVVIK